MEIKIKTKFWDERDPEKWIDRYVYLNFILMVYAMALLAYTIYTGSFIMAAFAVLPTVLSILIYISHNKRIIPIGNENNGQVKQHN